MQCRNKAEDTEVVMDFFSTREARVYTVLLDAVSLDVSNEDIFLLICTLIVKAIEFNTFANFNFSVCRHPNQDRLFLVF